MPDSATQFLEVLAASLGAMLSQLTGSEIRHQAALQNQPAPAEIWASAGFRDEDSCRLAIGITQNAGVLLARAMLTEPPGDADTMSSDDAELLAEFWRQSFGRMSTDLKPLLGSVTVEYADGQEPQWQPALSAAIHLQSEKTEVSAVVRLSMEMVRRITVGDNQSSPEVGDLPAEETANNLDLLLNVPLSVTLRFGQRRMSLREILQLTSGSVVELDRRAEDAVDLLLDERLIARGQVVVVDGCYGLRVSEVVR